MKKNMWLPIGLVIVVAVVVGYLVLHKSSSKTTTSTTTSTSTPAASSSAIIQTKTSSSAGSYLADASGSALYTYGADTNGVSNCSGACIASWPIYQVTSTSASLPANVSVVTRSDGSKQYAYKGLPLYTFTGDSGGQVTGDGVSNFHIAKP